MHRDDIDTSSSEAFLATFDSRAEEQFLRRMAEIQTRVAQYLTDDRTRELFQALVAMDKHHRYQMFSPVMYSTDGAETIDGMEAILNFIGIFILDDGTCKLVPFVPASNVQQTFHENIGFLAETPADAEKMTSQWLARHARWLQVVIGEDKTGRGCRGSELIQAIRHNEALHAEEEASYAADWPTSFDV